MTPSNDDTSRVDELLFYDPRDPHTLIDSSCTLAGDISCDARDRVIVVAGKLIGTIRSASPVVVLAGGLVEGSVRAPRLTIAGRITRRTDDDGVVVDGELALAATGSLECSAVYESLHTERGAALAGVLVPFASSFFHELYATGRLPFVDALPEYSEAICAPDAASSGGARPIPILRERRVGGEARQLRAVEIASGEGGLSLATGTDAA